MKTKNSTTTPQTLLPFNSIRRLAVFWGVSTDQVRLLIRNGELGHVRIGPRRFAITQEQAEAYIKRATQPANAR